ncbi:MAG: ComEC/Rec2 family competence protein, partial [Eubacterium sp.]
MKRVFAFIGFTCAITLIFLNIIPFKFSKLIFLSAVILFLLSLLTKSTRQAKVFPVVAGSVAFACFVFMLFTVNSVMPAKELDGKTADVKFQITDIAEYNSTLNKYIYTVKTLSIDSQSSVQNVKLSLYSSSEVNADAYDIVSAKVRFFSQGDNAFEQYGDYSDGIYIKGEIINCTDVVSTENKPPNYYFISIRKYINSVLLNNFDGDIAGLAIGFITGSKVYLSQEVQEDFRICGLSHFLAVSGFHISLVCLGLYSVLKLLKVSPAVNTLVSLMTVLLYCGVANYSKSAVRAGIMLGILLVSKLFNQKGDTLNSLGFAVFIICLNPFAVTDVSAVLTVCAMLGITVLYPAIRKEVKIKNRFFKRCFNYFAFSVCILLALMPAMYLFFKNISVGGVFLNIIIEPMISALIIASI